MWGSVCMSNNPRQPEARFQTDTPINKSSNQRLRLIGSLDSVHLIPRSRQGEASAADLSRDSATDVNKPCLREAGLHYPRTPGISGG